jgi:hypothetical protein
MVIISKTRRLVVYVDPVSLLFSVGLGTLAVCYRRPHWWQTLVDGLVASVVLAICLGLQRVTRRRGEELERWTIFGRRRVKAKRVFLGVTTGRGSVNFSLFLGKAMEPVDPSILVTSYGAYGLARPLRVARQLADVLDLPEPRLAPWLQAPP